MDNRSYLAILASGALFAVGAAGCDAGDPGDPGTPEPESSAMYDTDDTDRATDATADRETQAQQRMQQTEEDTWQTQQQASQQDPSYADPSEQGSSASAVGDLSTLGQEEIVGKSVVSQQGEEIGQIDEVVMDAGSQQQLAVIDVGGFLGIGEKSVAVSFDQLQLSDDGRVRSDLTRDTLESQPEYDPAQFGESEDPM